MDRPNFSLDTFKKNIEGMVQTNDRLANSDFSRQNVAPSRDYTQDEIDRIVNSGSLAEQRKLSLNYFNKDGFYKRILIYYATILKYTGILIPHTPTGKNLSSPHIQKRYYSALDYVDTIPLVETLTNISLEALISGTYFGAIHQISKDRFSLVDLPSQYCASRYRDFAGNDLVEFDVSYFDTLVDLGDKTAIMESFPDAILKHYKKWKKGKVASKWVRLPAEIGVCFKLARDGRPMFLSVIPRTIQYDQSVDDEQERVREEIRKIIVQKVPHLNDGTLLFESPEAQAMHDGTVGMLKGNKHLSVLTTYADVEAITSKGTNESAVDSLDKIMHNIYAEAGVSGQLFAPTNTQSITTSINNDIAYMMILGNKYTRFLTETINKLFSNSNITFTYRILPISIYTVDDYIINAHKLATNGYSFLLPALAMDLSQRDLIDIKDLENDILHLGDRLKPLASSYTSSDSSDDAGRPATDVEDKSDKTIQNEDSMGG